MDEITSISDHGNVRIPCRFLMEFSQFDPHYPVRPRLRERNRLMNEFAGMFRLGADQVSACYHNKILGVEPGFF